MENNTITHKHGVIPKRIGYSNLNSHSPLCNHETLNKFLYLSDLQSLAHGKFSGITNTPTHPPCSPSLNSFQRVTGTRNSDFHSSHWKTKRIQHLSRNISLSSLRQNPPANSSGWLTSKKKAQAHGFCSLLSTWREAGLECQLAHKTFNSILLVVLTTFKYFIENIFLWNTLLSRFLTASDLN